MWVINVLSGMFRKWSLCEKMANVFISLFLFFVSFLGFVVVVVVLLLLLLFWGGGALVPPTVIPTNMRVKGKHSINSVMAKNFKG